MSAMGISGIGLSAEVMRAIDELATGLRRDHREAAEHEAQRALDEGHKEAESMREQADLGLRGAVIGGSLLALSGGAQLVAAGCMDTKPDTHGAPLTDAEHKLTGEGSAALTSLGANNERWKAVAGAGSAVGQGGGLAQQAHADLGRKKEADGREHAARAQAASRRADAEQGAMQDAQKASDKARDTYQQMLALDHGAVMAVLRG